jgi:hypothetical protein
MRNVEQIGFEVKGKYLTNLGYYRDSRPKRLKNPLKPLPGQITLEPKFESFNAKNSEYKARRVQFEEPPGVTEQSRLSDLQQTAG